MIKSFTSQNFINSYDIGALNKNIIDELFYSDESLSKVLMQLPKESYDVKQSVVDNILDFAKTGMAS